MRTVKPPVVHDTTSRFEREVREAFKLLGTIPILNGVMVEVRVDGPTECNHPLQRVPLGYLIVDADGVVASQEVGGHSRTKLFLDSPSPTTARLWVF